MMGEIEPDTVVTLHVVVRPYAQSKGSGELSSSRAVCVYVSLSSHLECFRQREQ